MTGSLYTELENSHSSE